jgi:hypothetical protein
MTDKPKKLGAPPGPNVRSKRKLLLPASESKFTEQILLGMAAALQTGRMKMKQISLSDDREPGLLAYVRESGIVALHCQYSVNGRRPMIRVGTLPGTSIEDARKLTRTIRALAARGIDVEDGLHDRLMRELLEQGEAWTGH